MSPSLKRGNWAAREMSLIVQVVAEEITDITGDVKAPEHLYGDAASVAARRPMQLEAR